jgi:TolB-like protein
VNSPCAVRIVDIELDVERYELRRGGQQIRLERMPMELLILMASRSGQLVTRADIVKALWGANAFRDTDNGINTVIRKIRVALGEDPESPRYLLTVKGKGYRLEGVHVVSPQPPAATSPAAVRVLVLPFENKTDDACLNNFCDALADETSANLGMLNPEQILVIARTTAKCYRHTRKSIAEIAHELGLDYMLEGSLTRDTGRVRLRTQLVRCFDQTQVWSGSREMLATDALDIQTEVGVALAEEVSPALAEQQRRMPT